MQNDNKQAQKQEFHSLFLFVPDLFQDAYKVKKIFFLLNNSYYILVFWDVMS